MLSRTKARPLLALRDATYVSVQSQLACRNQEVWGLRWSTVGHEHIQLIEVLSYGELDEGKTTGSTRPIALPKLLASDLAAWKAALDSAGYPTGPDDFVFPGAITGRTGHQLGHMTGNQAKQWGGRYFKRAAKAVGEQHPQEHPIATATPYSLRRGGISLRIRAGEDRLIIAQECGTSVAMIDRHYSFAIDALRHDGPRPADTEREAARHLATQLRLARSGCR